MNINRQNYEEYFLLYVDNELNIAQRRAVESFIEQNPDLRAELLMLQETILPADNSTVFAGKESLFKTTSAFNPVNDTNCEEYFVLYADDELTNGQKDQVEQFVYRNPQHQANFELMQQAKLMPDMSIVHPDKYSLYRKEEDDKVVPLIPMRWWRMAAAAAVLFFVAGMGWYLSEGRNNGSEQDGLTPFVASTDSNATKSGKSGDQEGIASNDQQPKEGTVKDNQPKVGNAPAQRVTVPANPAVSNDALAINSKNQKKDKNISTPRNIIVPQDVQHSKDDEKEMALNKKVEVPATVDQTAKPEVSLAQVEVKPQDVQKQTGNATPSITSFPTPDEDVIYASTDNKKNKMRGFFRKVTRVFEKTANLDADGNERSGIRIANLEIALK